MAYYDSDEEMLKAEEERSDDELLEAEAATFREQTNQRGRFNFELEPVRVRRSGRNKYIRGAFQNSFMFRGIYIQEVHDAIMGLKLNKSSIGIPQKFIKLACDYISETLTIIFNQSLLQGIVPDILKISKVTPVDKGGETTDPANYRPISTLSGLYPNI